MRKRELIILIVVTIAVIFFIVLVYIFSNPESQPEPTTQPRPSGILNNLPSIQPLPSLATKPSPSPIVATTTEQLIDQLPFQSELFNVEYLGVTNRFVVTIKQDPYEANLQLAKKWFTDRGFNPDSLDIYYHAFPEVQK